MFFRHASLRESFWNIPQNHTVSRESVYLRLPSGGRPSLPLFLFIPWFFLESATACPVWKGSGLRMLLSWHRGYRLLLRGRGRQGMCSHGSVRLAHGWPASGLLPARPPQANTPSPSVNSLLGESTKPRALGLPYVVEPCGVHDIEAHEIDLALVLRKYVQ